MSSKLDKIKVISQEGKEILIDLVENHRGEEVTLTRKESDRLIRSYSGINNSIPNIIYALARCLCNIDENFVVRGNFREEGAARRISYDDSCFTFDLE